MEISMTRTAFKKWYRLARMYWHDAQHSGLPWVSQRRSYLAAAERIGVSKREAEHIFDRGLDDKIDPNKHMYAFSDHLSAHCDACA